MKYDYRFVVALDAQSFERAIQQHGRDGFELTIFDVQRDEFSRQCFYAVMEKQVQEGAQ